jgi:predicted membrane-bound mannosyltransferase
MNLVAEIEKFAQVKAGQGMYEVPIAIVSPPSDYWPLPFYLRKFKAVGYWSSVHEIPAAFKPDLLIISASMGDQASHIMGKETQSNFYGIRPGTLLLLVERKQ